MIRKISVMNWCSVHMTLVYLSVLQEGFRHIVVFVLNASRQLWIFVSVCLWCVLFWRPESFMMCVVLEAWVVYDVCCFGGLSRLWCVLFWRPESFMMCVVLEAWVVYDVCCSGGLSHWWCVLFWRPESLVMCVVLEAWVIDDVLFWRPESLVMCVVLLFFWGVWVIYSMCCCLDVIGHQWCGFCFDVIGH